MIIYYYLCVIQNLELQVEKGLINKDYLLEKLTKLEKDNQKLSSISLPLTPHSGRKLLTSSEDTEKSNTKLNQELGSQIPKHIVKSSITTKNKIVNANNSKKYGYFNNRGINNSITVKNNKHQLSLQNIQPLAHAHTFDAIDYEDYNVYEPFLFHGKALPHSPIPKGRTNRSGT